MVATGFVRRQGLQAPQETVSKGATFAPTSSARVGQYKECGTDFALRYPDAVAFVTPAASMICRSGILGWTV